MDIGSIRNYAHLANAFELSFNGEMRTFASTLISNHDADNVKSRLLA